MISRNKWVAALTAIPNDKLLSTVAQLSEGWQIKAKALPQSGLGMLKMQDGAFGEPFYLGEFPLSTAWVEVNTPEGHTAEGAAQVMDDRPELIEALALCDAILANQLPGWHVLVDLLEAGQSQRQNIANERKQILASTMVDFSMLDETEASDD